MNEPFTEVASIIAKGPAPKWLVLGLEHFSHFIGTKQISAKEQERYKTIFKQMHDAADLLIKRLPLFERLPLGPQPSYITELRQTLPKLRKNLARRRIRKGGRRPNAQRKFCAAVVVHAWGLIHGKPEPQSTTLLQACNDYWQACGQPDRGDIENWRRDAEEAADGRDAWIRRDLARMAEHN